MLMGSVYSSEGKPHSANLSRVRLQLGEITALGLEILVRIMDEPHLNSCIMHTNTIAYAYLQYIVYSEAYTSIRT